jgi:hypothetical protein
MNVMWCVKNNAVKRPMEASVSPTGSPSGKPKSGRKSPSPSKKAHHDQKRIEEAKRAAEEEEEEDDEAWLRVESEEDGGFQEEGKLGEIQGVPRTNLEASRRQKSLNRQNTPLPGEIERAASRSRDVVKVDSSFHEEDEQEEEAAEHRRRVQSFQSNRKDTPFPEQIAKTLSSSGPPRNGPSSRSQTPLVEVEGFIEEEDEDLIDLDRDDHPPSRSGSRGQQPQNGGKNSFNGPDEANDHRYISSQSAPSRNESFATSAGSRPSTNGDRNPRLRPLTPEGSFRREYSNDHPLAGGKGKYSKEKGAGKTEIKPKDFGTGGKTKKKKYERVAEVVSRQDQKKLELQRKLEALRKHQNDALLEVLEEERKAEETRNNMGRSVTDVTERNRRDTYAFDAFDHISTVLFIIYFAHIKNLTSLSLVRLDWSSCLRRNVSVPPSA